MLKEIKISDKFYQHDYHIFSVQFFNPDFFRLI